MAGCNLQFCQYNKVLRRPAREKRRAGPYELRRSTWRSAGSFLVYVVAAQPGGGNRVRGQRVRERGWCWLCYPVPSLLNLVPSLLDSVPSLLARLNLWQDRLLLRRIAAGVRQSTL
eukprot:6214088-Pleurochrysis_carterae.AAC.3